MQKAKSGYFFDQNELDFAPLGYVSPIVYEQQTCLS